MQAFQTIGQRGSRDDKGVISWTIPYIVEDLSEIFTVGTKPPLDGLAEVSRGWGDVEGIGLQVDVTFEGYVGNPEDSPNTYDYDASFKEETLLAHPLWSSLLKPIFRGSYDKDEKKIEFPEFLSKTGRGLSVAESAYASSGQASGAFDKNPMYGLETFLSLSSVFRFTYIRRTVPNSIFDRIGTIRKSLPGGFPTPSGRDWLIMPPKISQRGGVFQITEEMMLSQPGGWPDKVYAFIQK